jgi:hypothetical protein
VNFHQTLLPLAGTESLGGRRGHFDQFRDTVQYTVHTVYVRFFSKENSLKCVRHKESGVHLASEAENLNVKLQSEPAQNIPSVEEQMIN